MVLKGIPVEIYHSPSPLTSVKFRGTKYAVNFAEEHTMIGQKNTTKKQ
jgi:hypothetical protein